MATITMEMVGSVPDFSQILKEFPDLRARILGYMGKQAAVELAEMMEEGQKGVQFKNMDGNRKIRGTSRRMVTYSVGKGAKWAKVSSFPLNLYEQAGGRGGKIGKNIIRGTLKNSFSGRMSGLISEAENLIVDDWFNKNAKGGMRSL